MAYLLLFLAGALICNGIPHLTTGLCGEPFPTPFARPRGVGRSSPLTNFYWGSINLAVGAGLMFWRLPTVACGTGLTAAALGWLMIGSYLAWHFGRVRAGKIE